VPFVTTFNNTIKGNGTFLGSNYANAAYLANNDTSGLLLYSRTGTVAAMSLYASTRLFRVQAPFIIYEMQLVTEQGVCATSFATLMPNVSLDLPCESTPNTYASMVNFTIGTTRIKEAIQNWNANEAYTFALYYVADGVLSSENIFVVSRKLACRLPSPALN